MGKILGGSSRLNYMVYVNGHPNDYNSWFPDYEGLISLNITFFKINFTSLFFDFLFVADLFLKNRSLNTFVYFGRVFWFE